MSVATRTLISHLQYVTVQVKDHEVARRFYTEALGFEIDEDKTYPDGQRWLTVKAPGAETKIVLFADSHAHEEGGCCGSGGCGSCGPSYAWTGMVMATDDIEAAYRELQGRGVTFLQAPEAKSWGTDALFADPDGNVYNLVQSK
jgi:lactoylglutathione lyase